METKATTLLSISHWLPERFRSIEDHGEALRIRIFLLLIFLCIVPMLFLLMILLGAMIMGHADYWQPTLIVSFITGSQIACLLYFLQSGNINLCSIIYATIIYLLVGSAVMLTGGWTSPVCYFMLALPVLASLVVSRQAGLTFSLIALLLYSFFFLLHQRNYLGPQLIATEFIPYVSIGMWLTTLSFLVGCLILFDFSTEDLTSIIQQERTHWQKDLDIDELTNTLNPKSFTEKMQHNQSVQVQSDKDLAIIYIKISNLKKINHDSGFEAGDYLLQYTANAIRKVFPENTIYLCRYMPDSFVVAIKAVPNVGAFISHIVAMKKALHENILYNSQIALAPGFQIGASITSSNNLSFPDLIEAAKKHAQVNSDQLYIRKPDA